MRKGLVLGFALMLATSFGSAGSAGAVMSTLPLEGLRVTLGAHVSPKTLPKNEYVPVTATIFGKVGTTDATHPSALREVLLDVDRDLTVDTTGLPTCGRRQLAGHSPSAAKNACRDAIVGTGEADVEVYSGEAKPTIATARLTLFNGGTEKGETKLFIHAILSRFSPAALVAAATIQKNGSKLNMTLKTPAIADGRGSIVGFDFRLGRRYADEGKMRSYLAARCPDSTFEVSVSKMLFRNEAKEPNVAATTIMKGNIAVPCTPQD